MIARQPTVAYVLLGCLLTLGVTGCTEPLDPPRGAVDADASAAQAGADPASANDPGSSGAERGPTASASDIRLVEADKEVYLQTLARHENRVVLVDFWATWCAPCKTNFPKILAYGDQYGDAGLSIVSVSVDDASSREAALSFLRSIDADIDNLISKWGAGTETMDQFQIDGAVPYYKLYDRQGKLRYQFCVNPEGLENVEPLDQIEPRIKELLEE